MVKPDAQGGKPCITRRGLLRAGLGVAGLAACAGLGAVPRRASAVEFNPFDDNLASIFVGGDCDMWVLREIEGVTVVTGNLRLHQPAHAGLSLAGRVMWGMSTPPAAECTTLAVGGDVTFDNVLTALTGGNTRIGGSVAGSVSTFENGSVCGTGLLDRALATPTSNNLGVLGYSTSYWYDGADDTVIVPGIGSRAALTCENGSGSVADYNGYWDAVIAPMVAALRTLEATGDWSVSPIEIRDHDVYLCHDQSMQSVDSTWDAQLAFEGDGASLTQVFDLDMAALEDDLTACSRRQWSCAFNGIPDEASILVRVHGKDPFWHYGWTQWLNGQDCSTYVNAPTGDAGFTRYRDLASRVMWLFDDDCGEVTVDAAYGLYHGTGGDVVMYAAPKTYEFGDLEDKANPSMVTMGNLWPGSIICPGSFWQRGSTNGKLYVRDAFAFDTWEHHNVVWRGMRIPPTIDIPVEKVWEGAGYDKFWPGSITVRLFGGSDEVGSVTLSNDNEWKGTFRDLPLYDEGWQPISYVVREDEVAHFTAKVTGDTAVGFTVTNTLVVPNYTDITVRKIWTGEGAADALPDELVVHVVGTDGSDRPVTLTQANHWQATIDELPQIDARGEWITYSLEERDVPTGFALVSIDGDVESGWTVTNEHQKGEGSLTKEARNKSWL